MSGLSLPADIEPHLADGHQWSDPAVYCLRLETPNHIGSVWDDTFEARPSYFDELRESDYVLYVGATGHLIHRLEDHRDGDVRQAALLQVCEITGLRNIWWFADAGRAFERENGLAMTLAHEYPDAYVHSR